MSERLWKRHVGGIAWPTLLLATIVFCGSAAVWAGALTATLPLLAGAVVQTLLAYLAFTVAHEAAHGNIHGGNKRWRWLGEAAGWASGVLLFAPFPAFRVLHLQHHSHVNDGDADPDHWVAGDNAASVAARCVTILPYYYFTLLFGPSSRTNAGRKVRRTALWSLGAMAIGVAGLALAGLGTEALALWVAPAVLASGVLAFAFDWLPHQPHDNTERYHDTRVLLGPGFAVLTMGQSYHLVHHLYPRVPFYRYGACFRDLRPELESRGARIDDLTLR